MRRKIDADDILVICGGAMVGLGIAFIHWQAALIVVGLAFAFLGIRGSKVRRRR